MSDLTLVVLFLVAGFVLLISELVVVPGFTFFGIAGFVAYGIAFALAFSRLGVETTVVLFFGTTVATGLLLYLAGRAGIWNRLVNRTSERGFGSQNPDMGSLVGTLGEVVAPLRPAGKIRSEGRTIDVVAEGGFVEAGIEVEVVRVDGNRIVVRPRKPVKED